MPSMVPLTLCFSHGLTKAGTLQTIRTFYPFISFLFFSQCSIDSVDSVHWVSTALHQLQPIPYSAAANEEPAHCCALIFKSTCSSQLQSTSCRSPRHSYRGQSSFIVVSLKTARWASWIRMHLLGHLQVQRRSWPASKMLWLWRAVSSFSSHTMQYEAGSHCY